MTVAAAGPGSSVPAFPDPAASTMGAAGVGAPTVAVLGAGAWGTALACHLARQHPVRLWARRAAQADAMARDRRNDRFLPGIAVDAGVAITHDLAACVGAVGAEGLIVLAVPVAGLRETMLALAELRARSDRFSSVPVINLAKGLEAVSGQLPHQIAAETLPGQPFGVLSGPSFALEVAQCLPCALVAASGDDRVNARVQLAFHHHAMRIYRSSDLIGVELAGALKNIIAVAAGICDGLSLGLNARAALVTRGLAESARLGVALGAQPATFMGLAGIGDLILTSTGGLSRNRQVGLALAEGRAIQSITDNLGHVAEGVQCCPAVLERAAAVGVEMPIAQAVQQVLAGRMSARDAVSGLLARDPAFEIH